MKLYIKILNKKYTEAMTSAYWDVKLRAHNSADLLSHCGYFISHSNIVAFCCTALNSHCFRSAQLATDGRITRAANCCALSARIALPDQPLLAYVATSNLEPSPPLLAKRENPTWSTAKVSA